MNTNIFGKIFNIILVSVLTAGLFLTATPVQRSQAANFTAGTYNDLVDAINTANGNAESDTITLTDNITLTATLPSITSEITIEGDGYTLDGNDTYQVLNVRSSAHLTVTHVTIANGFSAGDGGGINCLFGCSVTVISSTITGNSANNGGGIFHLSPGLLTIQDSIFSLNTATLSGGGIFVPLGSVDVISSTFSENSAASGGAINNLVSLAASNSTFSANLATGDGGGIYSASSANLLTLNNVELYGNQAGDDGGGIFNSGGIATLENVSLSGNLAVDGGGLYNGVNSRAKLTDVDLLINQVSRNGGGFYNGGTFTITNSTISGNQAMDGGGMYNSVNGVIVLTSANILGNQVSNNGGGLYNRGTFTVTNSTISGNQALGNGGGAYLTSSSSLLQNAILWNNQDSSGTGTLASSIFNAGPTNSVRYSDLQGCGGSEAWEAACGTDNGVNIDADPAFVDPVDPASAPTTDGDVHVPASSPVVDAGDDGVCPSVDLDGRPRPLGLACDQGAYESYLVYYFPIAFGP